MRSTPADPGPARPPTALPFAMSYHGLAAHVHGERAVILNPLVVGERVRVFYMIIDVTENAPQ